MPVLWWVLLALAVPNPSAMDAPVTPFTLESVNSSEPGTLGGQDAIAGKVRAGKAFTRQQKEVVKQKNAQVNEGKTRCANCDVETVPARKHEKGVTPPLNETQVDHKVPKSKGGAGEVDNGQVLCRDCNLKKGNRDSSTEDSP